MHRIHRQDSPVFSTLVEVFLGAAYIFDQFISLLHARGGVSCHFSHSLELTGSSPRSWRCFYYPDCDPLHQKVFSTLVEVFLNFISFLQLPLSLLHARGGVSACSESATSLALSSPRSWRCFHFSESFHLFKIVFSTLVEVFLAFNASIAVSFRLLHARGGVSKMSINRLAVILSSPRSWRCFWCCYAKY